MVFLALIPRTPHTEELLNVLYANTGIAGLGLLVTAIQQTANNKLSFFHALFVQHILFFLGIGAAPIGECILVSRPFVSCSDFQRMQANTPGAEAALPWGLSYNSPQSSHSQLGRCTCGSTQKTSDLSLHATTTTK